MDNRYGEFMENHIYDSSMEGSLDYDFVKQPNIREVNGDNIHTHSKIYHVSNDIRMLIIQKKLKIVKNLT